MNEIEFSSPGTRVDLASEGRHPPAMAYVGRGDVERDRGVDGDRQVVVAEGRFGRVAVGRHLGRRILVAPEPLLAVDLDRDRLGVRLGGVDVARALGEDDADDEEDERAEADSRADAALDPARAPRAALGLLALGAAASGADDCRDRAQRGERREDHHDHVGGLGGARLRRGRGVGREQVGEGALRQRGEGAEGQRGRGSGLHGWTSGARQEAVILFTPTRNAVRRPAPFSVLYSPAP